MKILHLEDFKNEVEVLKDWAPPPHTVWAETDPLVHAPSISVLGGRAGFHRTAWSASGYIRSFSLDVQSGNGKLELAAKYVPLNGTTGSTGSDSWDAAIFFTIPELVDEVEIIRFESYYGGNHDFNLLIQHRGSVNTLLHRSQILIGTKQIVEIVITPTMVLTYIDNLLVNKSNVSGGKVYYGREIKRHNSSLLPFTFTFENLVIARVPLSSKLRRLHKVKVVSVPVSKLNGTAQDGTSPINALNVLTSDGESLSGTNSVEFSPVELQDKEKVLGSQTTMVVKSLSADQVSYSVKDGTTELQSKTIPVSATLNTREVLGDNQLEDYSNLNVELTVVDLEE